MVPVLYILCPLHSINRAALNFSIFNIRPIHEFVFRSHLLLPIQGRGPGQSFSFHWYETGFPLVMAANNSCTLTERLISWLPFSQVPLSTGKRQSGDHSHKDVHQKTILTNSSCHKKFYPVCNLEYNLLNSVIKIPTQTQIYSTYTVHL